MVKQFLRFGGDEIESQNIQFYSTIMVKTSNIFSIKKNLEKMLIVYE